MSSTGTRTPTPYSTVSGNSSGGAHSSFSSFHSPSPVKITNSTDVSFGAGGGTVNTTASASNPTGVPNETPQQQQSGASMVSALGSKSIGASTAPRSGSDSRTSGSSGSTRRSLNPFRSTSRDNHPSFDDCFNSYHAMRLANLGESNLGTAASPQHWNPGNTSAIAQQQLSMTDLGGHASGTGNAQQMSTSVGIGEGTTFGGISGVSAVTPTKQADPSMIPPASHNAPEERAQLKQKNLDFSTRTLDLSGDSDNNPFGDDNEKRRVMIHSLSQQNEATDLATSYQQHHQHTGHTATISAASFLTPPRPIEREESPTPPGSEHGSGGGHHALPNDMTPIAHRQSHHHTPQHHGAGGGAFSTPMVTPRRGSGMTPTDIEDKIVPLSAIASPIGAGGGSSTGSLPAAAAGVHPTMATPSNKPPLHPLLASPIVASPAGGAMALPSGHQPNQQLTSPIGTASSSSYQHQAAAVAAARRMDPPPAYNMHDEDPESAGSSGAAVAAAATTAATAPSAAVPVSSPSPSPHRTTKPISPEEMFPLFMNFINGTTEDTQDQILGLMKKAAGEASSSSPHQGVKSAAAGAKAKVHQQATAMGPGGLPIYPVPLSIHGDRSIAAQYQTPEQLADLLVPSSSIAAPPGSWSTVDPLNAASMPTKGYFAGDFGYYPPDFLGRNRLRYNTHDIQKLLGHHYDAGIQSVF